MTRVVPGNVFQENRFIKTEQQVENLENKVNVSHDILTSNLKKVSVNETQVRVHMVKVLALILIIAVMTGASSTI